MTTTHGELILFRWDPALQTLVHLQSLKVEGALGMFNSIIAEDFVTTNGTKKELYIASSHGIRRFDVQ